MSNNGNGGARCVVTMPPRNGKTQFCSVWLPLTYLGLWPDRSAILACYGADFAATWGRRSRNHVKTHGETLGLALGEVQSGAHWETTEGGGLISTGVGGDITGRGAHLLVIDDPVKNAEEALSPVYRERAYEWWQSTAASRLEPGASALCIMTRWHEDDLGGRLIRDGWEELRLPAFAEADDPMGRKEGEPLWPERFSVEELNRMRAERTPYWWAAMYEARPRPREGGLFEAQWWRIVKQPEPGLGRPVRWWDLAATEKRKLSDPDYLVGVKMAEKQGAYTVLNVVRVRIGAAHVPDQIERIAKADGHETQIWMPEDPGATGKLFASQMARRLRGFTVRFGRETGDKVQRAETFASKAAAGLVSLVEAPWNRDYIDEHGGFPAGRYDDQVDASSGAFAVLATGGSATLFADLEPSGVFERKTEAEKMRAMMGRERPRADEDDED